MRPGLLAGLTALAALLVLGTATATWLTVTVPGDLVDGVRLPDTSTSATGAELAATSVTAGAAGFAAVLPLALIGVADRATSALPGTAARGLAGLAGLAAAGLALSAVLTADPIQVTVLAGEPPQATTSPAQALHAVGGLLVLALTALSWRIPRTPAAAEASKYTVEAVQGVTTPIVRAEDEQEPDEWDLVQDEPGPDRGGGTS